MREWKLPVGSIVTPFSSFSPFYLIPLCPCPKQRIK